MTSFNHVLAGVTIAVTVQQPLLALPLALVSHFVLDAVPHFWHEKFDAWAKPLFIMISVDAVLSITFLTMGILLFPQHTALILGCAALATLPDWLWLLHYKYKVEHPFFDFHQKIQQFERPWGIFFELPFTIAILTLLWLLSR